MNRRNFIDKAGRGFFLGGIALVAGVLVARRQVVHGSSCTANFHCKNCSRLSECQLPEAETERNDG